MSHKRYKNPHTGYSRAQARDLVAAVIDEELEFEDQLAHVEFDDRSVAPLMFQGPPTASADQTADAAAAASAEPPASEPATRPGTVVHRGVASQPVERPANAAIRAVDRVLRALRRSG